MLALWFEAYVSAMEINFWTDSNVIGADYNTEDKRWLVQICQSNSKTRQLNPQHIVMATGVSGIPNKPKLAQLDSFKGQVIHSSQYSDGEDWKGRSAIVVGCGNSGHDIAQDLYSSGANVTMTQRSPSLVVNIEPSAQFPYILYEEDRSLEECDFITSSMPMPLVKKAHQHFTKKSLRGRPVTIKRLKENRVQVGFWEG